MQKLEKIQPVINAVTLLIVALLGYFGFIQGNEATARGVTNFNSLTLSDDLIVGGTSDLAGTLNYGADNLYPIGYASSGQQAVYGTDDITGTLSVSHGLTTVTFCLATLGEDPTAGAGDAAHVSVVVAANACTVKAWQDDFVTAATETNVAVHWLVIGAP